MKTIYKISLSLLLVTLTAYFVFAQTQGIQAQNTDSNMETGRIVVSTEGGFGIATTGNGAYYYPAGFPTEFIPLSKKRCDITIASPKWGYMTSVGPTYQEITISEAKNSTTSRNVQVCSSPYNEGATLCDGKIHLDDEYYLLRVDFAKAVPYFSVNYQCNA